MTGFERASGVSPTDPTKTLENGIAGPQIDTGVNATNATGDPSDILITARSIEIDGAGQIATSTHGQSDAGDIVITLSGHMDVTTSPLADFTAGVFSNSRTLNANASPSQAAAGDITITVTGAAPGEGWVTIAGSGILTEGYLNEGAAGAVTITATGPISIEGSRLRTQVADNTAASAGAITLVSTGSSVAIVDSELLTESRFAGDAGDVEIRAAESVTILDGSKISSTSETGGDAGDIRIIGSGVLIGNQSRISANFNDSASTAGPGSIVIRATAERESPPPTEDLGSAVAGVVRIVDSGITAENIGGRDSSAASTRGDITIGASETDDPNDPDDAKTDWVQISGSYVSTNVSAAGLGDDIYIKGVRGVRISDSATGYAESEGEDKSRTLITATSNESAASSGRITIEGGMDGVSLTRTDVDTTNAISGSNAEGTQTPSSISLSAPTGLVELDDANLYADTSGIVDAGDIIIDGATVHITGGAISAVSIVDLPDGEGIDSVGSAGNIVIIATDADPEGAAALQVDGPAQIKSDATEAHAAINADGLRLVADAGEIELTASTGSIVISGDASGKASLTSAAGVDAGRAGTVTLDGAGGITMTDAHVSTTVESGADHSPDGAATITVSGAGPVSLANTTLESETFGADAAGDIAISGSSVRITGGAISAASVRADEDVVNSGNAGNISIVASDPLVEPGREILLIDAASISTSAKDTDPLTADVGGAGTIVVRAEGGAARITGEAVLQSLSAGAHTGRAGQITVHGDEIVVDTARVNTSVESQRAGLAPAFITIESAGGISLTGAELEAGTAGVVDAGAITIDAGDALLLQSSIISASTSADGNAGSVTLAGGSIDVQGGNISTSTTGAGDANAITLTARGSVGSGGQGEALRISSGGSLASTAEAPASDPALAVGHAGRIKVASSGAAYIAGEVTTSAEATAGHAGSVSITSAGALTLDGAAVRTTVASPSEQQAARIDLASGGELILRDSEIDATTSGGARAGDIRITGSAILMEDGSFISSSTTGPGAAGNICVAASGAGCPAPAAKSEAALAQASSPARPIRLAAVVPGGGGVTVDTSGISTSTAGAGAAGNIEIAAGGQLILSNAVVQSASTAAQAGGAGGSITLRAGPPDPIVLQDSQVRTNAVSAGGGDITIDANGAPVLMRGATVEASAGAAGSGGNIAILDAGRTIMQRSVILAEAEQGNGGNINALFDDLVRDSESVISADSDEGNDGEIEISSPDADLDAAIQVQSVNASETPELSSSACAAGEERSTFVREGRGGVGSGIGTYLSSVGAAAGAIAPTSGSTRPSEGCR